MKFEPVIRNLLFAAIAMVNLPDCKGFLVSKPDLYASPIIPDFISKVNEGILLNIGFDIPRNIKDKTSPRLYIKGLSIMLKNMQAKANHSHLPQKTVGAPITRTGPLNVETQADGHFVSMNGTQNVEFEHGCWEMLWQVGKPAGSIICSFDLAKDVSRNDAVLQAGNVYMTFPVFSREGLSDLRARKANYETEIKKHTDLQAEELKKTSETKNLLMKAVHFRRAVAANEKVSLMRTNFYDKIPTVDDEMISFGDDLVLYKKGTVWSKASGGKAAKEIQVGQASVQH